MLQSGDMGVSEARVCPPGAVCGLRVAHAAKFQENVVSAVKRGPGKGPQGPGEEPFPVCCGGWGGPSLGGITRVLSLDAFLGTCRAENS